MQKKKTGEPAPEGEQAITEECVSIENENIEGSSEIACFSEEETNAPKTEAAEEHEASDEMIAPTEAAEAHEASDEAIKPAEEKEPKEKKKDRLRKKKLCKLVKKDFQKKNMDQYIELVADPLYVCRKCGRTAREMSSLCKPVPLPGAPVESGEAGSDKNQCDQDTMKI